MTATRLVESFTYQSTRENPALKHSYCTVFFSDHMQKSYSKTKKIGEGKHGQVYEMVSSDGEVVAVKEFFPISPSNLRHSDKATISEWIMYHHQLCINQSGYTKIMNGVGGYFTTKEPIVVTDKNILVSYPHDYMLMNYETGKKFHQVEIDSADEFFNLCIEILNAVEEFHKQNIVHGDLNSDTILVAKKAGKFRVNITGITHARKTGEPVYTQTLDISQVAPEFKKVQQLPANPNQDMYCLGKLFQKLFVDKAENFFSSSMAERITQLNGKLTYIKPSRPNIKDTIHDYQILQQKYKQEKLIEKLKKEIKNGKEFLQTFEDLHEDNKGEFLRLSEPFMMTLEGFPLIIPHLEKFIAKLNKYASEACVDTIMKKIARQFLESQPQAIKMSFKEKLCVFDNIEEQCTKTFYKKLLIGANAVYREDREKDPREYYTFARFFRRENSKQNKIMASEQLENDAKANNMRELKGPANEGALGALAVRLKKAM